MVRAVFLEAGETSVKESPKVSYLSTHVGNRVLKLFVNFRTSNGLFVVPVVPEDCLPKESPARWTG